eukprot:6486900-Amphidinium_carterae.3
MSFWWWCVHVLQYLLFFLLFQLDIERVVENRHGVQLLHVMTYSLAKSLARGSDDVLTVDLLVDEAEPASLWWHARRWFDSIGFQERGKETNLNKVWKREFSKWSEWSSSIGLAAEELSARSLTSLQATGSDTRGARDCYSIETRLLLLVQIGYMLHRQSVRDRQRCRDFLELLLQYCTPSSCAAPDAFAIESKVLCFHALDDAGFCAHARDHLEGSWTHRVDRCSRWLDCLVSLFQRRSCAACQCELRSALARAATSMFEARQTWGGTPSEVKDLAGPSGKRRRIEQSRAREQMQLGQLSLSTTRQIQTRDTINMLQCASRIFKDCTIVASTFDGGRCGKPARDHNFHWLLNVQTQECVLLPPLVRTEIKKDLFSQPPREKQRSETITYASMFGRQSSPRSHVFARQNKCGPATRHKCALPQKGAFFK